MTAKTDTAVPSEKRRLHIALVIKSFVSTGGAEKYAVETAQRLLERGHRIDLFARDIDPELARGMRVFEVPDRLGFSSVLSLYSFAKASAKLLEGRQYDIIHTHDKGCPGHVSTVHTFSFKRGMDKMSLLKKANEFLISPRAWLYLHMERRQTGSQWLAAVSDVIRQDIQTCWHRQEGIEVIPPGVDVERFSPERIRESREASRAKQGLSPGDLAVVFVGSEFRRKGLDALIPALGERMRLFVVGRGERMDHYQKLTREYGVSDRVVFTGLVDDVMDYYALADAVVLPSIAEAFGMTVLEGMACGLPVITSRAAGASCVIDPGKNGLILDDPATLGDMLNGLEDPQARAGMGTLARAAALSHTWEETAARYEALYYRIAGAVHPGV